NPRGCQQRGGSAMAEEGPFKAPSLALGPPIARQPRQRAEIALHEGVKTHKERAVAVMTGHWSSFRTGWSNSLVREDLSLRGAQRGVRAKAGKQSGADAALSARHCLPAGRNEKGTIPCNSAAAGDPWQERKE